MKTTLLIPSLFAIVVIFFRCQPPAALPAPLLVDSLSTVIEQQTLTIDSLGIVINRLQTPPESDQPQRVSLSASEKAIQQMVYAMHKSWEELPGSKDPSLMLQHFLPRFITEAIIIKEDNTAEARSYTHEDFAGYLKDITKDKQLAYAFYNTDFLDIQTKGDYFNTVYTADIDVQSKGELLRKLHAIVTITGKRDKGAWKVAHYSWVEFQYE